MRAELNHLHQAQGPGRSVIASLRRSAEPLSVLELSSHAGLSTLVVIPELTRMRDEGLVLRSDHPVQVGRTRAWTYHLTARGAREAARLRPSVGPRRTGPVPPVIETKAS